MKNIVLLAAVALVGGSAEAQHASRLGELRSLLQQHLAPSRLDAKPAQSNKPAPRESSAPQRQLSPQERAELRRQLSEFRRPAGKGS